jgi:hypothetical protein
VTVAPTAPRTLPRVEPLRAPDERPARQDLLDQIAKLERELGSALCSTWPRKGFEFGGVPGRGGPRLLSLDDLESLRDDLAERVREARRQLSERTKVEEQNRCLIEEMLLDPEKHKWVRVSHEDIGEPGCRDWHVRPRFGFLGMLLNWWRVVVSSGCPLAGRREAASGCLLRRRLGEQYEEARSLTSGIHYAGTGG